MRQTRDRQGNQGSGGLAKFEDVAAEAKNQQKVHDDETRRKSLEDQKRQIAKTLLTGSSFRLTALVIGRTPFKETSEWCDNYLTLLWPEIWIQKFKLDKLLCASIGFSRLFQWA